MKSTMFAFFTLSLSMAMIASAQDAVVGTGTVVAKQMPTAIRLSIQFKETAKDLPEALKNLKDRRDAAATQLAKFGARKDTIREGNPSMVNEAAQSARAMAMMARQGQKKKKTAATQKVTVAGSLTAEWPLPSGNLDELMLFTMQLKEKVSAADLAGQKEQKKLSAEEQEEQEEMEMLQQQFSDMSNSAKPGEPSFVFVAKISAEDQKKARAEAYQKAHHQAEQLTAAAGKKLGKLRGLQSTGDTNAQAAMVNAWRGYGAPYPSSSDGDEPTPTEDEGVSVSPVLGKIPFSFSIHATFEIND